MLFYAQWRQSGVNTAGARRGFSGILLQNTYICTNLKQTHGDGRKVVVQVAIKSAPFKVLPKMASNMGTNNEKMVGTDKIWYFLASPLGGGPNLKYYSA